MQNKTLVITDPVAELEPFLTWLRLQDHELNLVYSLENFLQTVETCAPTFILLGSHVSGIASLPMIAQLRSTPAMAALPVVIIGYQDHADDTHWRTESVLAGANEFICLPSIQYEAERRLTAIELAQQLATPEVKRLLDEAVQAATVALPCDTAWLLLGVGQVLHSRVIACDRGPTAAEVFLRIVTSNRGNQPSFPLLEGQSLLADAVLNRLPQVNITTAQIDSSSNGGMLARALKQLQLNYVHFLPLVALDQVVGLLVCANQTEHDLKQGRGMRLFQTVARQCITVIENARLITDMAAKQKQMETEQAFRRMVLDTMGEGLIVIDDQGLIRYANNRLLRMTGFTRQELYGNSVALLFPTDRRQALLSSIGRGSRTTAGFTQTLITKAGGKVPVLLSRATLPDNDQDYRVVLVLSDLTEQKRREIALERKSDQLGMLNIAVGKITSALSQAESMAAVLQAAFDLVDCQNACIFLFDAQHHDVLRLFSARGPTVETMYNQAIPLGQGLPGRAASLRAPLLVRDLRAVDYPGLLLEREGSSVICVPLMVMDDVIGVLEVINKDDGFFIDDDVDILSNLAAAASVAMENAQLFDQAQRQVNELTMMLDASSAVSSTLNIEGVLQVISQRLVEAMNVTRCQISTWDRGTSELGMIADVCNAYWLSGEGPKRAFSELPLLIAVLQREQPLVARLHDSKTDPRLREHLRASGMAHVLFVPLSIANSVVGLLELYHVEENDPFTLQQANAVRDGIIQWRNGMKRGTEWSSYDNLTDLFQNTYTASEATWCVVSWWDKRNKTVRAMREIGLAVWQEGRGVAYNLDQYPTLAMSVNQGLPMTLLPALLFNDPEELKLMNRTGAATGLSIPLVIHGRSEGVIKLLDISKDRAFEASEVSLCQAIANVVANALENARLYQRLEKRAEALQNAYDELREADNLKTQLLQNLAHEMKTPLMQAMFEMQLVAEETTLAVESREIVESTVTRLTKLAGRVDSMVQSHASKEMSFAAVNLADLLSRAISVKQTAAAKRGLDITVQGLPHEGINLRADFTNLVDALDHLLDNAIKFSVSPTHKRIEIHLDEYNAYQARISIRDYGIGIPRDLFDRIFQAGFQVDGGANRRFEGAGMGLARAKQVVEGHGGKLWVDSAVGEGSQFIFTIPLWTEDDPAATDSE